MGSRSSTNKYPGRHSQYEMPSRGKDAFLIQKMAVVLMCLCTCIGSTAPQNKKCTFPEKSPKDLFITERSFAKKWLARTYALFLFTSYYPLP